MHFTKYFRVYLPSTFHLVFWKISSNKHVSLPVAFIYAENNWQIITFKRVLKSKVQLFEYKSDTVTSLAFWVFFQQYKMFQIFYQYQVIEQYKIFQPFHLFHLYQIFQLHKQFCVSPIGASSAHFSSTILRPALADLVWKCNLD